jgi:hypothetical protein
VTFRHRLAFEIADDVFQFASDRLDEEKIHRRLAPLFLEIAGLAGTGSGPVDSVINRRACEGGVPHRGRIPAEVLERRLDCSIEIFGQGAQEAGIRRRDGVE